MTNSVNLAEHATALQTGLWIGGLMSFLTMLVLVLQVVAFFRQRTEKREISPSPLDVRAVHEYVTKPELVATAGELGRRIDRVESDRRTDVGELHEKVNGVAREVSGLTASVELTNARLVQMDGKLDRMIEALNEKSHSFQVDSAV